MSKSNHAKISKQYNILDELNSQIINIGYKYSGYWVVAQMCVYTPYQLYNLYLELDPLQVYDMKVAHFVSLSNSVVHWALSFLVYTTLMYAFRKSREQMSSIRFSLAIVQLRALFGFLEQANVLDDEDPAQSVFCTILILFTIIMNQQMILKIMPKQKCFFHFCNILALVGLLNRLYDLWQPERNKAILMVGNCFAMIFTISFFLYTNYSLNKESKDKKKIIQDVQSEIESEIRVLEQYQAMLNEMDAAILILENGRPTFANTTLREMMPSETARSSRNLMNVRIFKFSVLCAQDRNGSILSKETISLKQILGQDSDWFSDKLFWIQADMQSQINSRMIYSPNEKYE